MVLTGRILACAILLASLAASGGERAASATGGVGSFFFNPPRTIECRFGFGVVVCASFRSHRVAILNSAGAAQIATITRFGSQNPACRRPPGDDVPCWFQQGGKGPTLRFGVTVTDPDPRIYTCSSRTSGIVCRSLLSGRGFEISDDRVLNLPRMKH